MTEQKSSKKTIVIVAISVVATIGITAATLFALTQLQAPKLDTTAPSTNDTSAAEAQKSAPELEEEAKANVQKNPAEAQKKYTEAAEAYRKEGNVQKTIEMESNAATAALSAETPKEQTIPTPMVGGQ
jgi:hypothetical protein